MNNYASRRALAISMMPRGILAVRAQAPDKKATIDDLVNGLEDFKAKHNARYDAIEAELNEIATLNAARKLGAGESLSFRAEDPNYSAQFSNFFRNGAGEGEIQAAQHQGGRAQILAAMQTSPNENGGYLAPTEWDRRIQQAQRASSPMRRLAQVFRTTVGAYSTVWNDNQWGTGWVGETASRPATSTPGLTSITFGHGEIYANPAITQRLLDDAAFNIEEWLASSVEDEFNRQEGIAWISGDGVNKPFGFMQYIVGGTAATQHPGGTLGIDNSGAANGLTVDGLVDFMYKLPAPYRQNATWLMNSLTAAQISKMKDADGNLIWRESLMAGQPATLLGRPVEIDENMPALSANSMPIAFGDFARGYVINDRAGVRVLRDPYTNKPYVMFYTTKRVGGGVLDPNAIRLLKIAVS